MSKVEVRVSQAGESAGLGLFLSSSARAQHGPPARRWWWPFNRSSSGVSAHQRVPPLASFPLSSALTAANIASDPASGHGYGWMLGRGLVDERSVIMAYLVVERLKGQGSRLAPWLDVLPQVFHTPLWFTPQELRELRGTTLDKATAAMRGRLQSMWGRLEQVLQGVARDAGAQRVPTLEDLLWAHSVFWSRGQSLPVPRQGGATSQLLAQDPSAALLLEVHEGIVPGLDFCNHHSAGLPQCWWEVVSSPPPPNPALAQLSADAGEAAGAGQRQPEPDYVPPAGAIQLRLHRGASARPGQELFIDYGEKSNEELLMLYGFAVPNNPNDTVMLALPLAPQSTWDDVMNARMELFRARGMRPQFFLRAADVPASDVDAIPSTAGSRATGGSSSSGRAGSKGEAQLSPTLEEVLETLEVFVMDFKELGQRMRALQEEGPAGLQGGPRISARRAEREVGAADLRTLRSHAQLLGLRMGALSTLLRLLELRAVDLEDEAQGTCSLEDDLKLLAQGPASMPHRKWCCVVYRAEQKRIVRGWVRTVQRELQEVMRVLQKVEDAIKDKQRGSSSAGTAAAAKAQ